MTDPISDDVTLLATANAILSNRNPLGQGFANRLNDMALWVELMLDPTPLTEEILRASGWYLLGKSSWTRTNANLYVTWVERQCQWDVGIDVYDLGHVETVGDLRRLLSALHIDDEVVVPVDLKECGK